MGSGNDQHPPNPSHCENGIWVLAIDRVSKYIFAMVNQHCGRAKLLLSCYSLWPCLPFDVERRRDFGWSSPISFFPVDSIMPRHSRNWMQVHENITLVDYLAGLHNTASIPRNIL
ncbi:hypothetical protein CA54_00440 [Symmachiella macrocystis]|uniref:Uncharacterized protein n=1 Tax=Symmachiella macrocystis TaxID=2527985 RepID=A0A5C6BH02_9PLAN|nr:hypothetical protein CA54_00440 [Symmachiella macrocystis]